MKFTFNGFDLVINRYVRNLIERAIRNADNPRFEMANYYREKRWDTNLDTYLFSDFFILMHLEYLNGEDIGKYFGDDDYIEKLLDNKTLRKILNDKLIIEERVLAASKKKIINPKQNDNEEVSLHIKYKYNGFKIQRYIFTFYRELIAHAEITKKLNELSNWRKKYDSLGVREEEILKALLSKFNKKYTAQKKKNLRQNLVQKSGEEKPEKIAPRLWGNNNMDGIKVFRESLINHDLIDQISEAEFINHFTVNKTEPPINWKDKQNIFVRLMDDISFVFNSFYKSKQRKNISLDKLSKHFLIKGEKTTGIKLNSTRSSCDGFPVDKEAIRQQIKTNLKKFFPDSDTTVR